MPVKIEEEKMIKTILNLHRSTTCWSRVNGMNSIMQRNYTIAHYVDIHDQRVIVKMSNELEAKCSVKIENVIESPQFTNWLKAMSNTVEEYKLAMSTPNPEYVAPGAQWQDLIIKEIEIQSLDTFGSRHYIGFIKFKVNIFIRKSKQVAKTVEVNTPLSQHGSSNTSSTYSKIVKKSEEELLPLPGIVFSRGGSVGILIVLVCEGKEYLLLVQQPRIPIGTLKNLELPAGSIDENGFTKKLVAAKEVYEETGIEIKDTDLIDLSDLCFGNDFNGHYLSPGASDEYMRFFLYKTDITKEKLESLRGKYTGCENENEFIQLRIMEIDEAPRRVPDGKLIMALYLYNTYIKK